MARTEGQWKKGISLITPSEDVPILLRNSYLNFGGATIGETGYGIRDNSGTIEVKSSGGSWSSVSTGGGEANTAANLGAGTGIYASKVGVALNFKSLVAGTGMSLSNDSDTITLTATSSSGDVAGPASAVDDRIATFDGTTGKLIQDGGATIANVRDRSTHTGTQAASTISDFDTEVSNNSAVALNTAKVTNATHTGEVTGSGALTVDKTAITGKTLVSAAVGDHVLVADASDTDNLKKVTVQTIIDLAGAGVSDGDKGDIIVSGSGATWTVDNDAITYAKMQNVSATDRLLGRSTAGAGDVEELTPTEVRTMLNVADGANAYVHPNHSGDVTSVADGATTIANDVVTNAKLANVATSTIKGRSTAGTGDPEDLTATQVRTLLNVADGAEANVVDSVNSQTGAVVLDADDIDDTATTNKFVTASDLTTLSNTSGTNTGDQTLPTRDSLGLDTDDSPQFAGVNVGHATDTTITRVSAGVIAIEGETVVTEATEKFIYTVAISDETTALTTGTGKITFRMPAAVTLTDVRASVTTAPTGATLTFDINEGGTTILSTKLTIDATEKTSTTAATAAVISDTAIADDAEMTIDIDQVGSTIAGAGAKITFIGTYA